jgi:hypothetical protein
VSLFNSNKIFTTNSLAQPPPTATNQDPSIARLKILALQAKQRGDMPKAKEYVIQLRVYLSFYDICQFLS